MKQTNSSQYSHQIANGNYSREVKAFNTEWEKSRTSVVRKPISEEDGVTESFFEEQSPDTLRGYRTGLQRFYERYPDWDPQEVTGIGAMVEEDIRRFI